MFCLSQLWYLFGAPARLFAVVLYAISRALLRELKTIITYLHFDFFSVITEELMESSLYTT